MEFRKNASIQPSGISKRHLECTTLATADDRQSYPIVTYRKFLDWSEKTLQRAIGKSLQTSIRNSRNIRLVEKQSEECLRRK
ncbi:hypothetical protein BpHYR1_022257, partial [Brachionus plicatilis]